MNSSFITSRPGLVEETDDKILRDIRLHSDDKSALENGGLNLVWPRSLIA